MSEPARKKRKLSNRRTDEITWKKHENYNETLTKILQEVGEFEKVQGHKAKAKAYSKAVKALTSYDKKVESGEEARKIDGIGVKISAKIDEILKTGSLNKLTKLQSDEELAAIRLFQRISGVGPSAAIKWVRTDGFKTLEDLSKAKLNTHQAIGLKYFKEFEERIPRHEVSQLESIVLKNISKIDGNIIARTCGSYRRGKPSSGDIDILITHPSYSEKNKNKSFDILEKIIERLTKLNFLTDHLSKGAMKYMGVCQLPSDETPNPNIHRRIDLRLVYKEQYWCGMLFYFTFFFCFFVVLITCKALLYFTGSDYFNTQMR